MVSRAPEPEERLSLAERRARLMAEHAAIQAAAAAAPPTPLSIDELVERADDLAALPQVVMQVIHMTATVNVSANEIERIVSVDQALAARILTLANSSYYGLPRRIGSIREAIVFLGFKAVRNLAMTVTSFNLFLGKSDAQSLARRDLWKHSLNAGLCGKLIASVLPQAGISDEVFTASLLHDIGKMLMQKHMEDIYAKASDAARAQNLPFHLVEHEFFPFDHGAVGAALAAKWNLPPVLVEAIGLHHHPEMATLDPKTCAAVALANDLANAFGSENPPADAAAGLNELAVAVLDLKAEALHRLASACADELRAGSALAALMPH